MTDSRDELQGLLDSSQSQVGLLEEQMSSTCQSVALCLDSDIMLNTIRDKAADELDFFKSIYY